MSSMQESGVRSQASRSEYMREWVKRRKNNGLCLRHGTPVTRLKSCLDCRSNATQATSFAEPDAGVLLEQCLLCDNCGAYHHAGRGYLEGHHQRKGIKEGPNSSLIDYGKRKPSDRAQVWSLCGTCRKEGRDEWKYRRTYGWAGLCSKHAAPVRAQAGFKKGHQPTKKKTGILTHRSGATVLYDDRNPNNADKVRFACPDCCPLCNQQHFITMRYAESDTWLGLCKDCKQRRRLRVIDLPDGGTARRDPQNSGFGWAICPDCPEPKERYVSIPSDGSKEFLSFTGRCPEHAHARLRSRTRPYVHKSGAKIFPEKRDPNNSSRYALFVCANFGRSPNCLGESYGTFTQFEYEKWHGLCENCVSEWRHTHRKHTADLILDDGPDGLPGTQILFSQEGAQGVPIRHWGCRHTLPKKSRLAISTLTSAWRKGKSRWPPLCRDCRRDPSKMLQAITVNDGRQKDGEAEKRRGRKTGDTLIDYPNFIADFKPCMLEEWRAVGRLVSAVQQEAVLAKYHLKHPGDRIAPSTLRLRLGNAGYKEKWAGFVELVVMESTAG